MTRNEYIQQLVREDELLVSVRKSILEHDMPPISVAVELGRLLTLLVRSTGARRILEIGALGGYSGICLARGLPEDGKLVSLELNPDFANVARANLAHAGLIDRVEFKVGPAVDSLEALINEGAKFDFFFIDADKPNYPNYLELAIQLANSGALITADNVLLGDRVTDVNNHDPSPEGVRQFNQAMHTDARLEAVLLGVSDGFSIARVK
jgi:caffeoyl-CoA O-methyltransferase